jgi:hypothetical protein
MKTTRRGFTLMELTLATLLGAAVAGACFGVFAAIQRADHSRRVRSESMQSLSRLHRTMQRACRTLLLDLPSPAMAGAPAASPKRPRVALVEGGSGLQRLEVSLSQAPILGLVSGRPVDPASKYQPVRGAFELRERTDPRTGERTALTLWWTPFEEGGTEPLADAEVKIADNIKQIDIRFAKTNANKQLELFRNSSFADWGQVPAYVEVEVVMNDHEHARWMFEVSGITGSEIAAQAADADMPPALAQRYAGLAADPALASARARGNAAEEAAGAETPTDGGASPTTPTPPRTNTLSAEQRALIGASIRRFYELLRQRDGGGSDE